MSQMCDGVEQIQRTALLIPLDLPIQVSFHLKKNEDRKLLLRGD